MKRIISLFTAAILLVGTISISFVALAADFSNTTIDFSNTTYVYTGSEIIPEFCVQKDDNGSTTTLVENTDYTVSYSNNTKVGIATMTVYGTGIYNGCQPITATFKIAPKKVAKPSVTESTNSSISLKWTALNSDCGIDGYKVYSCDVNGNIKKKLATTSNTSVKISNLGLATKYYFVVRAYKTIGPDEYIHGAYSDVRAMSTKPNQVIVNSVKNASDKKSITVKWGHKNGSGYEIDYATKSDFSNKKTILVKGENTLSKKISVDATKTYYVKVRAYKEYETDKYNYGPRSIRVSNTYSTVYSTYSSKYVNNRNRTTNLKIASKAINGTVLQPGDTFSFNKVVGKRTTAKGYKSAHVFSGPNSTVMGVGGGVCQVASTMFNSALLGNFKIVERHQHSQRVSYVPLGRDAAIYWGSQDFKFKNNTSYPVKIFMGCKDGKIYCTIKTCHNVSPKKVTLKVSQSGRNFTLRRYVNGSVNYTTKSNY